MDAESSEVRRKRALTSKVPSGWRRRAFTTRMWARLRRALDRRAFRRACVRAVRRGSARFESVERFAFFIGYPRSGHTLIGALLNAHRHALIAQELNVLGEIRRGTRRELLFQMLVEKDRAFGESGWRWAGYDYAVPGQWQGRTERLVVIGDKKGGDTSRLLTYRPELLDRLRETVRVPLRIVHHVRNPFDNIATISRRHKVDPVAATDFYLLLAEVNAELHDRVGADEILISRHEEFVAEPRERLAELLDHLGLERDESYLDACAARVFESPRRTRDTIDWPDGLVERIERALPDLPPLSHYRFDS